MTEVVGRFAEKINVPAARASSSRGSSGPEGRGYGFLPHRD